MVSEPHLSFQHSAYKIIWATRLLGGLDRTIHDFTQDKPFHIEFESDPSTGFVGFRAGLTKPEPITIRMLVGDIVGNLRASLDFAWMGLVRGAKGNGASKQTLPITSNRKGLGKTVQKAEIGKYTEKAEWLLSERIGTHRDFADGGNHLIAALNDLSNWNKHNLIVTAPAVTRVPLVRMGNVTLNNVHVVGGVANAILVGCLSDRDVVEYEGDPIVEVVFREHTLVENQPVMPALNNMREACVDALKAFCEAFPSPDNPEFA